MRFIINVVVVFDTYNPLKREIKPNKQTETN